MNEDIINEISEDVKALLNFKIDTTITKTTKKNKQITKDNPKPGHTQYYEIADEPEIEHEPKPKNNDNEFTISEGVFLDLAMG